MSRDLRPDAVRPLSSLALRDYLLARGWERHPSRRSTVGIFRRPDSPDEEILVPFSGDFIDLDDALANAVEEVARFEARPAVEVLQDLLRPRADRLRFAVESRETADGSIGIEDAIAEMMPASEDASLKVGSSWSPRLPPPRDVPTVVRVERHYRPLLEQVARALRPSLRPSPDLYIGKVDALVGETGPTGRVEGEVVLAAQVEDEILRVRLDLSADDYQRAGDAHLRGLFVSVRGILRRGTRVHRLDEARDFTIVGA